MECCEGDMCNQASSEAGNTTAHNVTNPGVESNFTNAGKGPVEVSINQSAGFESCDQKEPDGFTREIHMYDLSWLFHRPALPAIFLFAHRFPAAPILPRCYGPSIAVAGPYDPYGCFQF